MFGKILDIYENNVLVENINQTIDTNLLNIHVVFQDEKRKIVGEIIKITKEAFQIILLGELHDTFFQNGILKVPSIHTSCRIIYKNELEMLIGSQNYGSKKTLLLGNSIQYEGFKITLNQNDFFSHHFAIIGNTGTGKSCGVARLLQNIFYFNNEAVPVNAHIVLFDVYGEYHSALKKMESIPNIHMKSYTTDTSDTEGELIYIPPYFLDVDDLAVLLDVNDSSLLPILEKTLQYVFIFKSTDPRSLAYKNDIIAKCLLDILSSGKNSTQIRDQIISILMKYHTEQLNLDSEIVQPGYTRTIRQCLNIDAQGKINAIQFVVDFLSEFTKVELESGIIGDDFVYDLEDIYYALEFALLSEGTLNSQSNSLKVRLHAIINSSMRQFFEAKKVLSKQEYIYEMFQTPLKEPAQIVNMNFNYIDDRFAKTLTKIFSRLFFLFATDLTNRGSYPIHIILEEAHRYVNKDRDTEILGYNIFDRITKEGRKYGVIMGFVTQRPSELSSTALSQCSNFIIFRLFHPEDLKIISSISANVTLRDLDKLKTLRPGMALAFGSSFPLPVIAKIDLPDPTPNSSNINISKTWYPNEKNIV